MSGRRRQEVETSPSDFGKDSGLLGPAMMLLGGIWTRLEVLGGLKADCLILLCVPALHILLALPPHVGTLLLAVLT